MYFINSIWEIWILKEKKKRPCFQANGQCFVASTTEAIDTGRQVKLNVRYS